MTTIRRVLLAAAGAGLARGLHQRLRDNPPDWPLPAKDWERRNFRGEAVSLLAGPALAGAAALAAGGTKPRRLGAAALLLGAGAGAAGLYDDYVTSRPDQARDKGFRGHVAALKQGRVSGGMVKLAAIGALSTLAGRAVARGPVDTVVTGGVIAGTANLVNLLDLRPGRAAKASLLLGVPLLAGPGGDVAAGAVGAAAGLLPDDLGERVMMGDTGANALGAVLGLALAASLGPKRRLAALGVLAGLTAASEKVSFTRVIERTPPLRALDQLGRRPAP
jgi:UDP-N-acetylmuramyl pentapeptide phosphotransferase/UDP-N-acetylglucosamine-1-phosphate transferase